jgi:hypothetical protein
MLLFIYAYQVRNGQCRAGLFYSHDGIHYSESDWNLSSFWNNEGSSWSSFLGAVETYAEPMEACVGVSMARG